MGRYQSHITSKTLWKSFQLVAVLTVIFVLLQGAEFSAQFESLPYYFLFYVILSSLPTLLVVVMTFVFPLGILWSINQFRESGEVLSMTIIGISEKEIKSWILKCGLLGAMITWLLVSILEPIAVTNRSIMIDNYSKKHIFSMLKPDTFHTQSQFVLHAEDVDARKHTLDEVFAAKQNNDGSWEVLIAKNLHEVSKNSVLLKDGHGTQFDLGDEKIRAIQFSQASIKPYEFLNLKKMDAEKEVVLTAFKLWQERSKPKSFARLCWMLGLPLISILLALMAANTMFDSIRLHSSFASIYYGLFYISCILTIVFVQRQTQKGYIDSFFIAMVIPYAMLFGLVYLYQPIQRWFLAKN